jgi:hypothetical protein
VPTQSSPAAAKVAGLAEAHALYFATQLQILRWVFVEADNSRVQQEHPRWTLANVRVEVTPAAPYAQAGDNNARVPLDVFLQRCRLSRMWNAAVAALHVGEEEDGPPGWRGVPAAARALRFADESVAAAGGGGGGGGGGAHEAPDEGHVEEAECPFPPGTVEAVRARLQELQAALKPPGVDAQAKRADVARPRDLLKRIKKARAADRDLYWEPYPDRARARERHGGKALLLRIPNAHDRAAPALCRPSAQEPAPLFRAIEEGLPLLLRFNLLPSFGDAPQWSLKACKSLVCEDERYRDDLDPRRGVPVLRAPPPEVAFADGESAAAHVMMVLDVLEVTTYLVDDDMGGGAEHTILCLLARNCWEDEHHHKGLHLISEEYLNARHVNPAMCASGPLW